MVLRVFQLAILLVVLLVVLLMVLRVVLQVVLLVFLVSGVVPQMVFRYLLILQAVPQYPCFLQRMYRLQMW